MKSVRIRSYSVQIRENTDQNNSAYGHFLRSVNVTANRFHWRYLTMYTSVVEGHIRQVKNASNGKYRNLVKMNETSILAVTVK